MELLNGPLDPSGSDTILFRCGCSAGPVGKLYMLRKPAKVSELFSSCSCTLKQLTCKECSKEWSQSKAVRKQKVGYPDLASTITMCPADGANFTVKQQQQQRGGSFKNGNYANYLQGWCVFMRGGQKNHSSRRKEDQRCSRPPLSAGKVVSFFSLEEKRRFGVNTMVMNIIF